MTQETREDCLEEAVPKPGPNLAREKCFRRGLLAGSVTEMLRSGQGQQDPVRAS